jgi:hypothetical protein
VIRIAVWIGAGVLLALILSQALLMGFGSGR